MARVYCAEPAWPKCRVRWQARHERDTALAACAPMRGMAASIVPGCLIPGGKSVASETTNPPFACIPACPSQSAVAGRSSLRPAHYPQVRHHQRLPLSACMPLACGCIGVRRQAQRDRALGMCSQAVPESGVALEDSLATALQIIHLRSPTGIVGNGQPCAGALHT